MLLVRLHGSLGEKFGREWFLDVKSPAEAIRAIDANRKGFRQWVISSTPEFGFRYAVLVNHKPRRLEEYGDPVPHEGTIDIIPGICGGGEDAWGWLSVILGVVLIIVGVILIGTGVGVGLILAGVSLLAGGLAVLLTPIPRVTEADTDAAESALASHHFSGARNTVGQGLPVPVGYGRLLIGSHMISFGVDNVFTGTIRPDIEKSNIRYLRKLERLFKSPGSLT